MLSKRHLNSDRLKIVACIQARMGSTRLKKKVLKKILGRTLIEHIFRRLKKTQEINEIVLTTSRKKENDVLVKHAKDIGLKYYRGEEKDLVSRLYQTNKEFKADALVRITGDCPLVDPKLIDKMVKIYRKNYKKIDFVTNVFPPTFPDGLDIEILSTSILERLDNEIKDSFYREGLTFYIMENPKKFRIYNFKNSINLSSMRWTVDYPEDLVFIREIYKTFDKKNKIFTIADILNFLKKNPPISKINAKWANKTVIAGDIRHGVLKRI
jgi:spore coat polysaccharide biosynthesis protein SpsF